MGTWSLDDVIVAVATPHPGGYRGIVRLSGPRVARVLEPWLDAPLPPDRRPGCHERMFQLPPPLGPVPVRVYHWPTERSYTGQPSAEVHTFGCLPILEAIAAACGRSGARPARAGEFTLRAFLAGKLDLTQAEAVWDAIHADSADSLADSLARLAGGLAGPLTQIRTRLLSLLAELEAGLDFAEEDITFLSAESVHEQCGEIQRSVDELIRRLPQRAVSGALPVVVFTGKPNAGKSTLINALAQTAVSITSDQPHTTRDAITRNVTWDDQTIMLVDTAGESTAPAGSLEDRAQEIRRQWLGRADLVVWCHDATQTPPGDRASRVQVAPGFPSNTPLLHVWTKVDRVLAGTAWNRSTDAVPESDRPTAPNPQEGPHDGPCPGGSTAAWCRTSGLTGEGVEALRRKILDAIRARPHSPRASPALGRARHHLEAARDALDRARRAVGDGVGEEVTALELRVALDEIGQLVGEVYTDDLLDEIFGRFCIGK